jgi:hypothetical protein
VTSRATTPPPSPVGSSVPPEGPAVSPAGEAAPLAAAVDAIASFVSFFEPGRFGGGDAALLVSLFARAERLCVSGRALAAARAVEARCHEASGHRSGAEWLAAATGESVGEAAGVLRLGEACGDHPGMEGALRGGRLSRSKARVLTGAVEADPDCEEDLCATAGTDSFRQLSDRCRRARAEARSKQDAAGLAAVLHGRRSCRTWTDEDGAFRLLARLTPEAGATLLASLAAESDRVFRRARRAGQRETPDAYRADALVALVTGRGIIGPGSRGTGGNGSGRGGTTTDTPDTDTPARERAPDPRAVVHLRVDLDALRRGSLARGEVCEIPGVGPVPVETARSLLGGRPVRPRHHRRGGRDDGLPSRALHPHPAEDRPLRAGPALRGPRVRRGRGARVRPLGALLRRGRPGLPGQHRPPLPPPPLPAHPPGVHPSPGGPGRWQWEPPEARRAPKRARPRTRRARAPGTTTGRRPPPATGTADPEDTDDTDDPPLFSLEE